MHQLKNVSTVFKLEKKDTWKKDDSEVIQQPTKIYIFK